MPKKRRTVHRPTLAGQVAVITGASRGIGFAIAGALARQGCSLAISARNPKELADAAKKLSRYGVKILALPCDVRDESAVSAFFAQLKKTFRRIDLLVNNAGISHAMAGTDKLPVSTWGDVLDTNLTGTFLCTRAALPLMRSGSTIVNNLSGAARHVFAGQSAYCASKHGGLGLTGCLREELRPRGIRVIALLPGPTDTEIWKQFWPGAPRRRMMSAKTVADVLLAAILAPPNAAVEEIQIAPTSGAL